MGCLRLKTHVEPPCNAASWPPCQGLAARRLWCPQNTSGDIHERTKVALPFPKPNVRFSERLGLEDSGSPPRKASLPTSETPCHPNIDPLSGGWSPGEFYVSITMPWRPGMLQNSEWNSVVPSNHCVLLWEIHKILQRRLSLIPSSGKVAPRILISLLWWIWYKLTVTGYSSSSGSSVC
jgi:hypothetical protein